MSEQKREVVHDIFVNEHCIALSNHPWPLAQARQIWVSTCMEDALEWFDYLCAGSNLSCPQTIRQCVYCTECLGTRRAPPLIKIHKVLIGASLSEPHTSESNGGFFIYYYYYYYYIYIYLSAVRTSFRKCRLSSFNPKHCTR